MHLTTFQAIITPSPRLHAPFLFIMSSTATVTLESSVPLPGGKLNYVTFVIPQSHHYSGLLAQVCAEINYEILSGEPRLCRDVRASVVTSQTGEFISIANLHDNHAKYFNQLFDDKDRPNEFFETLLRDVRREMGFLTQQLTQNKLATVYRSSDWLQV